MVQDSPSKISFFEKTFLLADISIKVVLGISFLTLSDVDIWFAKKELIQRSYITTKALSTTKRVELINKSKFATAAMDENSEMLMIYVITLKVPELGSVKILIHFSRAAQVGKSDLIQDATLQQNQAPTKVLSKYTDFADVFSLNLAIELLENTGINKHAIKLEEGKQPSYRSTYALNPVKLEILKTYIEIYLKTGFNQPSKLPADVPYYLIKS